MFYNSFITFLLKGTKEYSVLGITSYILTGRSKIFKRKQVFHMVVSHMQCVSVPNNCVPYKSVSATVIHICACSKGICSTCVVCVRVEDCVSYSETQEGGDKVRNARAIPGRLLIHRKTWNQEIRFFKVAGSLCIEGFVNTIQMTKSWKQFDSWSLWTVYQM